MEVFGEKVQTLMNEFYDEWQKEENKNKSKWEVLDNFSEVHKIAVVFGNFNNQVENGGIEQWIYNGYFHDDGEKFSEYLERSAAQDERCRTILDRVYKLDQNAQENNCDRHGYYSDPGDEDKESRSISETIDCEAFDTWYYEHCGDEDWWKTVCEIIEPSLSPAQKSLHEQNLSTPDLDTLIQRLRIRLEDNFNDYKDAMLRLDSAEVFNVAKEITKINQFYNHFHNKHEFTADQAEFLLKFYNPLQVLSDTVTPGHGDINDAAEFIFSKHNQEQTLKSNYYELAFDDPEIVSISAAVQGKTNAAITSVEKPSVMDEIRQSQKDVELHPSVPKDKSSEQAARKKSDPDL